VDRCNFSEKDSPDFTFIWVHDRRDQCSGIRDGWTWDKSKTNWHKMAAWHDTEKPHESFLIRPTFDQNFNPQMGKKFPFHLILCFVFMIQDDLSQSQLIRPRLAVRVDLVRLLYLPVCFTLQAYSMINSLWFQKRGMLGFKIVASIDVFDITHGWSLNWYKHAWSLSMKLTWFFSTTLFNIITASVFCSHIICQKCFAVWGKGPLKHK